MASATGRPATDALAEWNPSVLFVYEPSAELDIDVDDVVVARVAWSSGRQPLSVAAVRPVAILTLGRRVPVLAGLTREEATAKLERLQFVLAAEPSTAPATWVVSTQSPEADTIVDFTPANTVAVTLRDPIVEEPGGPWWGLSPLTAVAVGGSFVALLVVLLVLGSLLVRRAVRRRAGPDAAAAEHVEVRVYAGQVVGPELTMRGQA